MDLKEQSINYVRSAASAPQTLDLLTDFGLKDAIIAQIQVVLRGNMVSGGGGAISGFHRDAPCGMLTALKLWGGYKARGGQRVILDAPPQQQFYPGNFMAGLFHALLRTSAGASSTDPFRATIPLPLVDPNARTAGVTYIDCRDYASLQMDLRWAADADLATTNLSSVASVELEVKIITVENGPRQGFPHYEPNIVYKELAASTASTRLVDNGSLPWDGDLWSLWTQQHDDSASGDSERVDGLVRALFATQGKREAVPYSRTDPLRRATWEKYNPSLTTTEVTGVQVLTFSPPRKSRMGTILLGRDTSSSNPLGVTAITPATSDALFCLLVAAEPVHGAPI